MCRVLYNGAGHFSVELIHFDRWRFEIVLCARYRSCGGLRTFIVSKTYGGLGPHIFHFEIVLMFHVGAEAWDEKDIVRFILGVLLIVG